MAVSAHEQNRHVNHTGQSIQMECTVACRCAMQTMRSKRCQEANAKQTVPSRQRQAVAA